MERGEPALKPVWLVRSPAGCSGGSGIAASTGPRAGISSHTDEQGKGGSSRNRDRSLQPSSRRGSGAIGSRRHDRDKDGLGKSRGYASFGRNNRERMREKDFDLHDSENRSVLVADDGPRDGFESFSSCRPERDRLNRARLKVADTWAKGVGVSPTNGSLSRSNTGSGVSFERDFPYLGAEEKNGRHDVGRVSSPGINTPIQSISLVPMPDGWNSVLAEVPVLNGANGPASSSVSQTAPSSHGLEGSSTGTVLSMAETVMQASPRVSTGSQLSIDPQKIEERARKQCLQLRPLTDSMTKSSASSPSDKLKNKGTRAGDSIAPLKVAQHPSSLPVSSTVCAPVRTELTKPSQLGIFQVLSRDQNGVAHTTMKECTSKPASPVLAPTAPVLKNQIVDQKSKGAINGLPLPSPQGSSGERRSNSNAKDRLKFFESLRSKSSNGLNTASESGCHASLSSSANPEQNSHSDDPEGVSTLVDSMLKVMENGSCTLEGMNSCEESENNEITNSSSEPAKAREDNSLVLEPVDPEEAAFLKSLGWNENEEVLPLRKEEIEAFQMMYKERYSR